MNADRTAENKPAWRVSAWVRTVVINALTNTRSVSISSLQSFMRSSSNSLTTFSIAAHPVGWPERTYFVSTAVFSIPESVKPFLLGDLSESDVSEASMDDKLVELVGLEDSPAALRAFLACHSFQSIHRCRSFTSYHCLKLLLLPARPLPEALFLESDTRASSSSTAAGALSADVPSESAGVV